MPLIMRQEIQECTINPCSVFEMKQMKPEEVLLSHEDDEILC